MALIRSDAADEPLNSAVHFALRRDFLWYNANNPKTND